MARILCIDTDAGTVGALQAAGHEVFQGTLGYQDGRPRVETPPHEVDLIVCDLWKPACYDSDRWGPGLNDNFTCTVVPNPTVEFKQVHGRTVPRFRLVQQTQMTPNPPGSFGRDDIRRAISRAGVPAVLMLNPDWQHHVAHESVDICGVQWRFALTKAERIEVRDPFSSVFPEIEKEIRIARPLLYEIVEEQAPRRGNSDTVGIDGIVVNSVGQQFGQVVRIGAGALWAIPKLEDNAKILVLAASRIDALRPRPSAKATKSLDTIVTAPGDRDVFISHASEDKAAIARPLVEALVAEGVSVWFDEYELRLGDRLRERIDDGLRRSRFGVVIMSHDFFAKQWPKAELDGLFELEQGGKKILSIWHGLGASEVRQYSPILSGRLAVPTNRGLAHIVAEILRVVRPR